MAPIFEETCSSLYYSNDVKLHVIEQGTPGRIPF